MIRTGKEDAKEFEHIATLKRLYKKLDRLEKLLLKLKEKKKVVV